MIALKGYIVYIFILIVFWFLYTNLQFSEKLNWINIKNKRKEKRQEFKLINDFEIIKSKLSKLKSHYPNINNQVVTNWNDEPTTLQVEFSNLIAEFVENKFYFDRIQTQTLDYAKMGVDNKTL